MPWSVRELQLLPAVEVIVCLGAFAWEAALRLVGMLSSPPAGMPKPKPRFGHGARWGASSHTLLGCFHPSQQNTFTGKLTEPMIDEVLLRARSLAGLGGPRA